MLVFKTRTKFVIIFLATVPRNGKLTDNDYDKEVVGEVRNRQSPFVIYHFHDLQV